MLCREPRPANLIGGLCPIRTFGLISFDMRLCYNPAFFSFSTADEDYHAPNEFFRIHRLHEGLEAWARYWTILGDLHP